ncbi:MAG: alpha/beta hydrolase [Candidatus Magasanikbacteria bacterium]|nr:alpha/beta hydrolase [Candidatus Magasanikbacteria bacterium]
MQLVEFKNYKGEVLRGLLDKTNSKRGVIFLHGFERTGVEMKFKNLRDEIFRKVSVFRFDFSGCGLSDGKFEDVTVEKMTKELGEAIELFKKLVPQLKEIILVGHSIAGCVTINFALKNPDSLFKIVLLGPALNQQELLKYYSVRAKMWVQKVFIDWNNFRQYFVPEEFVQDLKIKKRMRKSHWISDKYFLESKNRDYQKFIESISVIPQNILIVHGDSDNKVPLESNNNLPKGLKFIKVIKGDHELERPDMVRQYLTKVIKFILK